MRAILDLFKKTSSHPHVDQALSEEVHEGKASVVEAAPASSSAPGSPATPAASSSSSAAKSKHKKEKGKEKKPATEEETKKMERYHADPRYQRLEDFFLSPAASTENAGKNSADEQPIELLADDDIGTLMRLHVDDFDSMKCRRGERQILELILNSYHSGLPLYDKDPVVKQHTARSIQFIFDFVIKQPENVQKKILSRLADAFTACQAEQGRVLDAMYGSLSGRDKSLKDQIIAAVDEYKERVLDQVANELNPNAWKQDDSEPTKQLPHIMSSYKVAVGHDLALRGVKTAISDTNKFDLCSKKKKKVISTFRRLFDVHDIVQTFKNDVNQQGVEAERLIDRDQLSRWAGNSEENHGFPSHSIFFDEDHPEAYGESKPLEENMYQPFLSDPVTLDVFEHLFLKP